jgi:hypothetical protein
MVDNGLAKKVLSVVPAVILTASAEFLTHDAILGIAKPALNKGIAKPALNNFKLWTNKTDIMLANLKAVDQIIDQIKIDCINTCIQTELFNIFLSDAVDAPELAEDIHLNVDLTSDF